MRKVAPILKPIAVLTISTIVATTTGIVNSSSYRAPSSSSSTVEETTPTTSVSTSEPTTTESLNETTTTSTWDDTTIVRRMMRHIQLTAQAKQVIRYQMALHRIQPIQVQVRIQVRPKRYQAVRL